MDITMNAQTDKDNHYVRSGKRMMELVFIRALNFYLHPKFIFYRTRYGREHKECIKHLHGATDKVIKKKRQGIVNRGNITIGGANGFKLKTFLDYLMELSDNGKHLTDEEVREEVNTLMIAGNETTASVNCFTMLMLANFPEIQQKVYEELYQIFGDSLFDERLNIALSQLNQMEYLEQVLKEGMRLFPIGSIIARTFKADFDLDERILPKGSGVVIGIWSLHRSEKYWDNPLKFDPSRFTPEESAKRHPFCYIAFSAGPRNCIGMKYVMMSMKTLLTTVVRHYVLLKDEPAAIEDIEVELHVTLKPMKPFAIRIERRIPPQ